MEDPNRPYWVYRCLRNNMEESLKSFAEEGLILRAGAKYCEQQDHLDQRLPNHTGWEEIEQVDHVLDLDEDLHVLLLGERQPEQQRLNEDAHPHQAAQPGGGLAVCQRVTAP